MISQWQLLGLCLALAACPGQRRSADAVSDTAALANTPTADSSVVGAPLAGTSWQLVRFQSMNDWTFTPADRGTYTVAFEPGGRVSIRADCNRGTGTWSLPDANVIQFGPIASTKAMCPPESLSDQFLRDFQYMTSYILKDGMLHIALMADGGIYDFERMEKQP